MPEELSKVLEKKLESIELSTILTFITAGMYLSGRRYIGVYFYNFAIQHTALNFSTLDYITYGFYPLLFCILFLLLVVFINKNPSHRTLYAFQGNIPSFLLVLFFFLKGLLEHGKHLSVFLIVISFLLLFLTLIATFKKKSLAFYLWKLTATKRFVGFVLSLFLSVLIAEVLADFHANKILKGNESNLVHIKFILKANSPANVILKKKEYVLIIQKNGKYYVTEKLQQPVHLLIISESEVSLAEAFFGNR